MVVIVVVIQWLNGNILIESRGSLHPALWQEGCGRVGQLWLCYHGVLTETHRLRSRACYWLGHPTGALNHQTQATGFLCTACTDVSFQLTHNQNGG